MMLTHDFAGITILNVNHIPYPVRMVGTWFWTFVLDIMFITSYIQ